GSFGLTAEDARRNRTARHGARGVAYNSGANASRRSRHGSGRRPGACSIPSQAADRGLWDTDLQHGVRSVGSARSASASPAPYPAGSIRTAPAPKAYERITVSKYRGSGT